jgi:allantoicase
MSKKISKNSAAASSAELTATYSFTDYPDLAAEALGGAAIACNDEFFAEKENLLRGHDAVWKEHEYTDRGKWMDGWETRRRRQPGHDWCVIRLGLPGIVHGVVVDTAYFRGNYPDSCSIEACAIDAPLDLAALARAAWTELVPQSPLSGNSKNLFAVTAGVRATHLRLNIFPDGGVARLRVHGEVVPDWARLLALGGPIDLAALEHGAHVMACSDMFFGSRHNLIKPGRSFNMSDGWETRRRRGPGHDWSLIRLGVPGTIERVEIDTSHFKGNAPGRCLVEAVHLPGAEIAALVDPRAPWRTVLDTAAQPHTRHQFDRQLRRVGVASHLRLSVFPDGGVARLRVMGFPEMASHPALAGLAALNALPADEAQAELLLACGSPAWAAAMSTARPFVSEAELLRAADRVWWSLKERDWLQAFAAHPQIGSKSSSKWSQREQSGAARAAQKTKASLAKANRAYAQKHGFIFIVCALGRSADEMLALCEQRLGNSRRVEIRTAAEEQAMISRLRLCRWLEEHRA